MKKILFILICLCGFSSAYLTAQNLHRPSSIETLMEKEGFLDVQQEIPDVKVELMYARADNFTGKLLYKDLHRAYLHPEAIEALKKCVKALQKEQPDYRLLICDAARPMSIQQHMWNVVKGTPQAPYVSNPANGGGLHNYGLAVDLTLVDQNGKRLDMGTPVDHLGKEAHIDTEDQMVQNGIITRKARLNRQLLRRVMQAGGFRPLRTEWWHFNLRTRAEAKAHYKVIP